MDIAGEAAALTLLRGDDLFGEILVGLLAGRHLAVQPRLVQGARDEAADHQQQFDIAGGEVTSGDGVHVEHAHQSTRLGLHRHRGHRGEVPTPQRRNRNVTGIGLLVADDHHRLAVAGHPPRHP